MSLAGGPRAGSLGAALLRDEKSPPCESSDRLITFPLPRSDDGATTFDARKLDGEINLRGREHKGRKPRSGPAVTSCQQSAPRVNALGRLVCRSRTRTFGGSYPMN